MSHSSLFIHRAPETRNNHCYFPEHVEPPRSYADLMNGTAIKRTASSSSISSLRMGNGSLDHLYVPSMATTSDNCGRFVPYANWADTPSFASGSVESPSVSSSFDFNGLPKDEPCFDSLLFNAADHKTPSTQSRNLQFGDSHTSGLGQASQWTPWTNEPELSSQSYFLDNPTEVQNWSNPRPLTNPSPVPFFGLSYPVPTFSTIPGGQTGMLIAELPTSNDHTQPRPHSHSQPTVLPPAQIRELFQSEHPSPTSSSGSIKTSLHYSDSRDALLIEWKRRGLSYKDIKHIGGFKEAESTLRGRFRTLTKAKEQRVRKPKWTETDIQLLIEAVSNYSESGLSVSGSPPKVSWKKVAQHIWAHGGSYQFGNATCKKKWCEIHNLKA
ncbi:uncharacterized protein N7443_003137 [Penicillium atrosanguineum]|uniref:uncharacterized protein n=1 Tax=Penicillium atrosanguineum TaxID=1132637 RepID=UPI00239652D0|nr:uncharacterized protein N7443_003137 [Penicillium atrosanguineum]KAJ5310676.1 hypothetical protein N7443_003137 [Penicillium atrosanguineum]